LVEGRLMRDVNAKLKSLKRIETVQKQIVRLGEARLASAEQACRDLAADQARLRDYVGTEGSLGVSLAKAALKSIHTVDRRLVLAERERETRKDRLREQRKRESVVGRMAKATAVVARRADEDREVALAVDAWIAAASAKGASLP
jgi:hypothetical protein